MSQAKNKTGKVIILGNSGAGKSTLAKVMARKYNLTHLDLDTLAWKNTNPPTRKTLKESTPLIDQFIESNEHWVIEGCYADLLQHTIDNGNPHELIFLNPDIETCINNCRNRAWEPHKYKSADEQNSNLDMLINWVKQYPNREDDFSLKMHRKLFSEFTGKKSEYNKVVID
ncbi:MAG TPA: ATP-binding cassette domain-containing protein [Gammaproteobacteria bacterium]|nr:ATP-binding cassette domain-containing protein [Gammaproteobacteria bacterium]